VLVCSFPFAIFWYISTLVVLSISNQAPTTICLTNNCGDVMLKHLKLGETKVPSDEPLLMVLPMAGFGSAANLQHKHLCASNAGITLSTWQQLVCKKRKREKETIIKQ
jgi:hypothetical protein